MERMIDLKPYDLIIVNSSGGKDSLCALWKIAAMASLQGIPKDRIVVSHQDLGESEWEGVQELVFKQAELYGLKTIVSKRRDKNGYNETLLEYAERHGKWPSRAQRWCTSDYKRGPGSRVVTALTKEMGECQVLYVFGFRKQESPFRSKLEHFSLNKRLSTQRRTVYDYLPIHDWKLTDVWDCIKRHKLPYHWAYDLGMPRLSCVFCIFSPKDALVIAGKHNPELLDKYIAVEKKIGHTFKNGFAISEIKELINQGYAPQAVPDWVM